MAQYTNNYDESVFVAEPVLVPGLRGRAREFLHYPDPLVEPPIGPIYESNHGYPWTFIPHRMATFVPNVPHLNVTRSGNDIKPYRFRAQQVSELSTRNCI